MTKLLFYTKKDCPLCVEGYATTARLAKRCGLEVVKVDIQTDGALFERFKERIPVVEADGKSSPGAASASEGSLDSSPSGWTQPETPNPR